MVLLKANKIFLDQDAAPVVEMMSMHLLKVLHASPHIPAVLLDHEAPAQVAGTHHEHNESKPEVPVRLEPKVAIVVHGEERLRPVEVSFV